MKYTETYQPTEFVPNPDGTPCFTSPVICDREATETERMIIENSVRLCTVGMSIEEVRCNFNLPSLSSPPTPPIDAHTGTEQPIGDNSKWLHESWKNKKDEHGFFELKAPSIRLALYPWNYTLSMCGKIIRARVFTQDILSFAGVSRIGGLIDLLETRGNCSLLKYGKPYGRDCSVECLGRQEDWLYFKIEVQ